MIQIISGGQTGVDRAALDAAIELNIMYGGFCPKGRLAELGDIIPLKYALIETSSSDYSERTKLNISNSDGMLIIVPCLPLPQKINDGTILTMRYVLEANKPHLIVDISKARSIDDIVAWVRRHSIKILNIGGSRESQCPGIYLLTFSFLKKVFSALNLKI